MSCSCLRTGVDRPGLRYACGGLGLNQFDCEAVRQAQAHGPYLLGGFSITNDFQPSPWVLFRLEYSHRASNQPYFAGHGGITGPGGIQAPLVPTFQPDLEKSDDRLIVNATLRL